MCEPCRIRILLEFFSPKIMSYTMHEIWVILTDKNVKQTVNVEFKDSFDFKEYR